MKSFNSYSKFCNRICIFFALVGCGDSNDSLELPQSHLDTTALEQKSEEHLNAKSACLIRAGYGIPACHIGMRASEVNGEWSIDDEHRDEYRLNSERGIDFVVHDGKVSTIFFYVRPQDDSEAYPCGTDKGISGTSTQEDVRAAYGDPSYIGRGEYLNDDGSARPVEVFVVYAELGIDFRFVGGVLDVIGVSAPAQNFDYDDIQELMGEWIVYVRPPENRPTRVRSPADQLR